jgi:arabinofuranan 3-O-arabinosyltransferase
MVDEQSLAEPAVDRAVPPVELVSVVDPVPVVRASDNVVVLSGSGDGIVDAAAAGLIAGDEAILYSASLSGSELDEAIAAADFVVVTDSNRRRAHHWRGSQDVSGYTEQTSGSSTVWDDSGDARLPVFPTTDAAASTVTLLDGPLEVSASSYGERFAYLPEARPAMAIDGDPNTAWTVLDPTDQFIEITTPESVDHVILLQPGGLADVRRLRTVTVTVDGGEPTVVELDERSLIAGQRISFPATAGPATIRVELGDVAPAPGFHRGHGHPDRTPVGVAEIDAGLGGTAELIVVPTDLTTAMSEGGIERPVTYVLTRDRVRATNRFRSDPEWRIVRRIDIPFTQDVDVTATVRLDLRAPDAVLAELLGITGSTATARLTGVPAAGGWAAADGDPDTAWITPFTHVVGAALNAELVDPRAPLTIQQRQGNYSLVTALRLTQGERTVDVLVSPEDSDGVSSIAVPDGFDAGPLRIEIAAITERTTRDRRFADTVVMPAAITEIGNIVESSLPTRFDTGCREDLVAVDGKPVSVRVAGSVSGAFDGDTLDATTCGGTVTLPAGEHQVTGQQSRRSGLQVDRVVLAGDDAPAVGGDHTADDDEPKATVVDSDRLSRTITVERCPEGCWLIVGEGYHVSWSAATAAGSLGPPQLVAGGFNGWWIPPHDGAVTVWVGWTAQRPLNAAIAVSLAAAIVAIVLAIVDRGRRSLPSALCAIARWTSLRTDGLRRSIAAAVAWTVLAGLFVDRYWAWWGLLGGAALVVTRRIRLAGLVAVAAVVYIAVDVVTTVRRDHPPATPSFPLLFENLHHLGLFAAVAVAVSALARSRLRDDR